MKPTEHHAKFFNGTHVPIRGRDGAADWNAHMGRDRELCSGCKYANHHKGYAACAACPFDIVYIPAAELPAFTIWKATQHDL